jgi:hypothetical protein
LCGFFFLVSIETELPEFWQSGLSAQHAACAFTMNAVHVPAFKHSLPAFETPRVAARWLMLLLV